ncbi:formate dehydrogenase accessory sulfurtransferase FdhD [Sulfoacidibacillus thermotolerans]|uniref:Sulfur carrier protein FdhD n=1 Tax=Sulfoacidibacillus thermotolerans TaxID=1765684 RepID=A0A2U3D9I7_SULT2|nr:formate dehydrogenase accessory sulfurtransferase FdhD [Sulfoacidibacillus thermotolerans]PWI57948.1 sufurtransferase FdhD [Sulfoacidibacillus thermotolerans]
MDQPLVNLRHVYEFEQGKYVEATTDVVAEYALTVFVNGQEFATLVCTPAKLQELVLGFIASEGLIITIDEVQSLEVNEESGMAYVQLHKNVEMNPDHFTKRYISSCCGKGRQSYYFYNDAQTLPILTEGPWLLPQQVIALVQQMQRHSTLFLNTGGVHNAALCDVSGILVAREDIGRHNALDKLYGYILQNRVPVTDKVMVFSGRISSEVLLKVAKMGIGILLSKSAPTELALRMADDLGITAVGFVRGERFKVYTHPRRILL